MRNNRLARVIGWIFSSLVALVLVFSVWGKLFLAQMQDNMASYGLGNWTLTIALGELVSGILFMIPKTNRLGVLLLSAHMGGAIVTHMSHGESFLLPSSILVLVWISGHLRTGKVLI